MGRVQFTSTTSHVLRTCSYVEPLVLFPLAVCIDVILFSIKSCNIANGSTYLRKCDSGPQCFLRCLLSTNQSIGRILDNYVM